jgi:Xaa-Pro dipeptidase
MPGDMITIDVAGVYNRYHSDLGRTISVGEPHKEVAKVIDLAVKSWPVFLESIKPNCPMAEVTKTLEDYYRKAGIWEDRWLCGGYDLGCSFPPSWVGFFYYDSNETRKPSGRLFSPGTVVNYEANFYLPQGEGLSLLVDTITVSESGAEVMSKISPDLIVK